MAQEIPPPLAESLPARKSKGRRMAKKCLAHPGEEVEGGGQNKLKAEADKERGRRSQLAPLLSLLRLIRVMRLLLG